MTKRNFIIATAAAALFSTGVYAASDFDSKGNNFAGVSYEKNKCKTPVSCKCEYNHCKGHNKCKGTNQCKGTNKCKGTNRCKGTNSCKASNCCKNTHDGCDSCKK